MSSVALPVTSSGQDLDVKDMGSHSGILGRHDDRVVRFLHLSALWPLYLAPKFYPPGSQLFAVHRLPGHVSPLASWCAPLERYSSGASAASLARKYAFIVTLSRSWAALPRWSAHCPAMRPPAGFHPSFSSYCACSRAWHLGGEYGGAAVYVAERVPDTQARLSTPASSRSRPRSVCSSPLP